MALPPLVRQLVEKKMKKYCEEKIPYELLEKIRVKYRVRGNSVTLIESRLYWNDPSDWSNMAIAQFRYDPENKTWTLYCADRNNRWHLYIDTESTPNLDDLLKEVDKDPTGIFWG